RTCLRERVDRLGADEARFRSDLCGPCPGQHLPLQRRRMSFDLATERIGRELPRASPRERDLAGERQGGEIEQLMVRDEQALDLRLKRLRETQRGLDGGLLRVVG